MSHITLIASLKEAKYSHVIVEILSATDIKNSGVSLDKAILDHVEGNLKQKGEKKAKTMTFALSDKNVKKVTFFFPSKGALMDDRSEFFRSLESESVFVPAHDVVGAYEALRLATYRYQNYLSKKKKYEFELVLSAKEQKEIEAKMPLYDAIIEARDLINMPAHDANPESLVKHTLAHKWKHFDVHVFDEKELEKLGCNLILAVGAGSKKPPYMMVLTPKKAPKGEKYALIGKGVTFDAGGIQIKPDTAMLDMKCDMSGAAAVLGVAKYLDTLSTLPTNVVIAVGLTENMTGGNAYKPLDIYKAHNGTTVEIHHTDAEGRLVLADVMSYVEATYKVDHMITIATLT